MRRRYEPALLLSKICVAPLERVESVRRFGGIFQMTSILNLNICRHPFPTSPAHHDRLFNGQGASRKYNRRSKSTGHAYPPLVAPTAVPPPFFTQNTSSIFPRQTKYQLQHLLVSILPARFTDGVSCTSSRRRTLQQRADSDAYNGGNRKYRRDEESEEEAKVFRYAHGQGWRVELEV